ncbi:hypothetical protein L7F22_003325 [Adiantum nelumboides]|nr:hypothetical protein [Adiantum nelumboides]
MKMAELLRTHRDNMQSVGESEVLELGGEEALEDLDVDEKSDVHDKDTEIWQLCHLRENTGYIMEEKDVSPKLVAKVFNVSHKPLQKLNKVTDVVMRTEFGQPKGWCGFVENSTVFIFYSTLIRLICNQEAMILTLETQKDEGERIDSLEQQVSHLQSRVDEVLKGKTTLQEELARINANMQNRVTDMAWTTQEFQLWADELRTAIEKKFQEVKDKIAHLIADNNFLMNRLTPLVDLEKAMLDGQGVTGVLIADAEVDTLKKEVFDYTKELWHQVVGLSQEHMEKPIDKYKSWFEAAGEYKVREENAELKALFESFSSPTVHLIVAVSSTMLFFAIVQGEEDFRMVYTEEDIVLTRASKSSSCQRRIANSEVWALSIDEHKQKLDDAIKRMEEKLRDNSYTYLSIANPLHGEEFFSMLFKKDWSDKSMIGITKDKLYSLCSAKITIEIRKELLHTMI